jgi:hypothetical protein
MTMTRRSVAPLPPGAATPPPGEAGFTVLELIVTSLITVVMMIVVLTAVDMNASVTRVQADLSDLQQSTRVAQRDMQRMVRLAGRGGLPRDRSVAVVQDAQDLDVGGEEVVDGSDVITVRGAFSSPVFRVDPSDPASFVTAGTTATLRIDGITKSAFVQPLDALHALHDEGSGTTTPEAILLVGGQGESVFAVVEMTDVQFQTVTIDVQNESRQTERATLTLSIDAGAGGHAGEYLALSSTPGTFPANLDTVAFATVIEEHRFFIREDFSIPGDATSPPSPKLARARMVPGTETLHPTDGSTDIADNVFDLQVALGVDLDGDGRIDVAADDGTPLDPSADEWLWNDEGDDETLAWDTSSLQHVRLTILGQAQTPDRQYISPALDRLENRAYGEPAVPSDGGDIEARRYRRRLLQSSVDLRNL